jgi:Lar family restriction alleviation protein
MVMSEELKSCPFCGGEAGVERSMTGMFYPEDTFRVCCMNCRIGTEPWSTIEIAIKDWNTRHDDKGEGQDA